MCGAPAAAPELAKQRGPCATLHTLPPLQISTHTHHPLPPPWQINLSPDKARVLREAWRVLAPGGEMFFSDVYCDRRLPQEASAARPPAAGDEPPGLADTGQRRPAQPAPGERARSCCMPRLGRLATAQCRQLASLWQKVACACAPSRHLCCAVRRQSRSAPFMPTHACAPPRCPQVRTHPVLLGECLGGALYTQDFVRLCREVGDPAAWPCPARALPTARTVSVPPAMLAPVLPCLGGLLLPCGLGCSCRTRLPSTTSLL